MNVKGLCLKCERILRELLFISVFMVESENLPKREKERSLISVVQL